MSLTNKKYNDYTISDCSEKYRIELIYFLKKLMSKNLNSVIKTTYESIYCFLRFKIKEFLSKIIAFFVNLTLGVYLIHIKNYLYNIY
jgi:hypothetical protein